MGQAQHRFTADPAVRVSAPAPRRRGPGSTAQGRRSRDRVLQASIDLITEAGIDQVRLAKIAERAGMSPGQVMYYFTSKEHILLEALAWREHEDTRRRRAALRKTDGAWRQLRRFVDLFLPASPVDPSWILWIEAWARAPHDPAVSTFLDELMLPYREDLAQIIERGVQQGAFAPPAAVGDFTARFCALLDGLAIFHLRYKPSLPRHRVAELAMDAARAELAPPADAPAPSPAALSSLPAARDVGEGPGADLDDRRGGAADGRRVHTGSTVGAGVKCSRPPLLRQSRMGRGRRR